MTTPRIRGASARDVETARAPELYGDEWQARIRQADAARRESETKDERNEN